MLKATLHYRVLSKIISHSARSAYPSLTYPTRIAEQPVSDQLLSCPISCCPILDDPIRISLSVFQIELTNTVVAVLDPDVGVPVDVLLAKGPFNLVKGEDWRAGPRWIYPDKTTLFSFFIKSNTVKKNFF